VLAWVGVHLPPGFAPAGTGIGTRFGTGTGTGSESWTGMFALPAVPGVLTQRELVVLAVRSGSQTAIRVDVQVVWLPARPGAERIPPTAAVLTVTPVFGLNPDPRAERLDRAFTVTDPATVARIAAVVNGLPRSPRVRSAARPTPAARCGSPSPLAIAGASWPVEPGSAS
jgi:hypothetical protein